jgi:3-methyladenine DNA glycosylase AlkD
MATSSTKKKPVRAALTLDDAMAALEAAGSAQTRATYLRHGAPEPLFGVNAPTHKALLKRIGVDHALARALWDTGNFDARMLALRVADPGAMSRADLDRWADQCPGTMGATPLAHLAAEGPHGRASADAWLGSRSAARRRVGWALVGALAMVDAAAPDGWFAERLARIERDLHAAPNEERKAMHQALIQIGCRSAALRKAAGAAAKRIGVVEIDHGDTACKTPEAAGYIEKSWAHSTAKGFASPAAHERSRAPLRLRC